MGWHISIPGHPQDSADNQRHFTLVFMEIFSRCVRDNEQGQKLFSTLIVSSDQNLLPMPNIYIYFESIIVFVHNRHKQIPFRQLFGCASAHVAYGTKNQYL